MAQFARDVVTEVIFECHRFAVYRHFILAPWSGMLMPIRATDMENTMRVLALALLAFVFVSSALAQQSAPPSDQPPLDQSSAPSASAPPADQQAPAMGRPGAGGRQANPRRVVCVNKARQKGLRGTEMRDNVQLCVEEARLACTKQAIEQKIPAQQRRDFMKNCAG